MFLYKSHLTAEVTYPKIGAPGTMDDEGFGELLYFYSENSDIEFDDVLVPSDTKQDRIFITQTDPPDEKGIYYKVSDLED